MKTDEQFKRVRKDVKAHRDFLLRVLDENEEDFRRVLSEAKDFNPSLYLRTYLELSKLVTPKQQDVNVSLSINKDFQELQALASSGQTQRSIEDIASDMSPTFLEYEELTPKDFEL